MAVNILGMSPREAEWNERSKIYEGHRYDHLADWSDPTAKLHEKRPSVQIRLTKLAIDTGNDYLMGDEQRPILTVEGDTEASEELQEIMRAAGLAVHYTELGRKGLLHGSVCVAFHRFEGGRWDTELVRLNAAEPVFGRDDRRRAIELGIGFDDLLELNEYWRSYERRGMGRGEDVERLHRRTWTPTQLIEYEPVEATRIASAGEINWRVDKSRTVTHNLGFVPAEWIPNGYVDGDADGRPLIGPPEYLIEDAVNYAVSQAVRGVEYNSEPWIALLNTQIGNPNTIKRGAGRMLSVEGIPGGHAADARILEMTGTGQQTALQLIMMMRQAFFEVAKIVVHDPQKFAGTLSGEALRRLLQPTVMLIKGLRPIYGHHLARLGRKMLAAERGGRLDDQPDVVAVWPDIMPPTDMELSERIRTVGDAHERGYLTFQTAVQEIAPLFGVEDTGGYIGDLQAEEAMLGTLAAALRPPETPAPVAERDRSPFADLPITGGE